MKKVFERFFNKKYLIITFVVGIIMMLFPGIGGKSSEKESDINNFEKISEKRLERIVKQIDGIKQADVFITYRDSGSTDYAYERSSSDNKNDLKLRLEDKKPVIYRHVNPEIEGVLLVVKGTGVKESTLCSIIKAATGVPLHRISVVISGGA